MRSTNPLITVFAAPSPVSITRNFRVELPLFKTNTFIGFSLFLSLTQPVVVRPLFDGLQASLKKSTIRIDYSNGC